jgi:hypothetical protein
MTLNASGPLSLGGATTGQSINLELGQSATALASINATNFRTLAGVPSGQISISNFYGKSNAVGWVLTIGLSGSDGTADSSYNTYGFFVDSNGNSAVAIRDAASGNYGSRYIDKTGANLSSYMSGAGVGGRRPQARNCQSVNGTYVLQTDYLTANTNFYIYNTVASPTSFSQSLASLQTWSVGSGWTVDSNPFYRNCYVLDSDGTVYGLNLITKDKNSPQNMLFKSNSSGSSGTALYYATFFFPSLHKWSNGSFVAQAMVASTTGQPKSAFVNVAASTYTTVYGYTVTGSWVQNGLSCVDYTNNLAFQMWPVSTTVMRVVRFDSTLENTHAVSLTGGANTYRSDGRMIGMAVYGSYLYLAIGSNLGGFNFIVLNTSDLTTAWSKYIAQGYMNQGLAGYTSMYANANGVFIATQHTGAGYMYLMQFPLANTLANATTVLTGGNLTISNLSLTNAAITTWTKTATALGPSAQGASGTSSSNTPTLYSNPFALNKVNI